MARILQVPAGAAWEALVDTAQWSSWGPSVRGAVLDGRGTHLGPGSTGRVRTAVGVSLPFVVTDWELGHRWAWRVAGIPATGHRVEPLGADSCRAVIEVPLWAGAYAALCWVALGRLGAAAT